MTPNDELVALLEELLHKYDNAASWDSADWDRLRALLTRLRSDGPDMLKPGEVILVLPVVKESEDEFDVPPFV